MTTAFAAHLAADRRLRYLQLLEQSNAYASNESLLGVALDAWGHKVSHDQVRTDLAWLAEQGLITVEEKGGIQIATATTRGIDVIAGRVRQPGVRRPGPEA